MLITSYSNLFSTPSTLPAPWKTNQQIPLTFNTNAINVRPYRYPHFQKQEIESQIQEMLNQWIIQPTSCAFSSSVLLVRKKYSTCRFCVDYRTLNAITIHDKFLIPAIDELLEKLYGIQCFTKLDMGSGYHKIRMHPDDIHKTIFHTHRCH